VPGCGTLFTWAWQIYGKAVLCVVILCKGCEHTLILKVAVEFGHWRECSCLFVSMGWDCLWTAASNGPIVHPLDDIWEWRAMVEWCGQWKLKNSERNLSQCHFVHHKFQMDWPGPPRWEAEPWHGLRKCSYKQHKYKVTKLFWQYSMGGGDCHLDAGWLTGVPLQARVRCALPPFVAVRPTLFGTGGSVSCVGYSSWDYCQML
jgi:hypothetical protein